MWTRAARPEDNVRMLTQKKGQKTFKKPLDKPFKVWYNKDVNEGNLLINKKLGCDLRKIGDWYYD